MSARQRTPQATAIAVVADTHLPRRGPLPAACVDVLRAADVIVHAGDLSDLAALASLRALGPPLVAVAGNVEAPEVVAALPATAEIDAGGLRIGVIHDAGPERGRGARMRRRFPDAAIVLFGHSHIPMDRAEPGAPRLVNPGSPTDRRRQPRATMAVLHVAPGIAPAVEFHAVDDPPGPLDPALVRR